MSKKWLLIFDFDETLMRQDSYFYKYDFIDKKAIHKETNKIYDMTSDYFVDRQLIPYLKSIKQNCILVVATAGNKDFITNIILTMFGDDIFDYIMSNDFCIKDMTFDENNYKIKKRETSVHIYHNDVMTKNPCLMKIMDKYKDDISIDKVIFFDNHKSLIESADKILKNVIHCEKPLDKITLERILKKYMHDNKKYIVHKRKKLIN